MILGNKIVFSNENIYCTPISSEHISLGWLDWINDQETTKYKKITGQDPDKKAKTKILSRVHKRMST